MRRPPPWTGRYLAELGHVIVGEEPGEIEEDLEVGQAGGQVTRGVALWEEGLAAEEQEEGA